MIARELIDVSSYYTDLLLEVSSDEKDNIRTEQQIEE
jgi:hypothetical protein